MFPPNTILRKCLFYRSRHILSEGINTYIIDQLTTETLLLLLNFAFFEQFDDVYTYTCTHTHMHIHIQIHMHTHTHAHTHTDTHTY